jgi:hypothetical protein
MLSTLDVLDAVTTAVCYRKKPRTLALARTKILVFLWITISLCSYSVLRQNK